MYGLPINENSPDCFFFFFFRINIKLFEENSLLKVIDVFFCKIYAILNNIYTKHTYPLVTILYDTFD